MGYRDVVTLVWQFGMSTHFVSMHSKSYLPFVLFSPPLEIRVQGYCISVSICFAVQLPAFYVQSWVNQVSAEGNREHFRETGKAAVTSVLGQIKFLSLWFIYFFATESDNVPHAMYISSNADKKSWWSTLLWYNFVYCKHDVSILPKCAWKRSFTLCTWCSGDAKRFVPWLFNWCSIRAWPFLLKLVKCLHFAWSAENVCMLGLAAAIPWTEFSILCPAESSRLQPSVCTAGGRVHFLIATGHTLES